MGGGGRGKGRGEGRGASDVGSLVEAKVIGFRRARLMEELSYRHLYRVDRAHLGNFPIAPAAGASEREDDSLSLNREVLPTDTDSVTAFQTAPMAYSRVYTTSTRRSAHWKKPAAVHTQLKASWKVWLKQR